MCMSISSVPCHWDFGCQNVGTRRAWKRPSRKRIFAGSFWTHTACYLRNRARGAQFMRLVIRLRGRRRWRGPPTQAVKSGAHTRVIRAIQCIGNFTETSAWIFPRNTRGGSPPWRKKKYRGVKKKKQNKASEE